MAEEQSSEIVPEESSEVEYELPALSEAEQDEAEQFALKVIKAAASLKVIRIDRGKFLRTELRKHCPDANIDLAVAETPGAAGIPSEVLDAIAVEAIDFETKKMRCTFLCRRHSRRFGPCCRSACGLGPVLRTCYAH